MLQVAIYLSAIDLDDQRTGFPWLQCPTGQSAFFQPMGKTFQIETFDELGCAELNLHGKIVQTPFGSSLLSRA
jgi:hypothetical protein